MNEYLLKEDMNVIQNWANEKKIIISFRKTGLPALNCLERGAGAKPHSILEKTIKGEKTSKIINDYLMKFPEQYRHLFYGLVGHWKYNDKSFEREKVIGLYLTSKGVKEITSYDYETIAKTHIKLIEIDGNKILNIDNDEQLKRFCEIIEQYAMIFNKSIEYIISSWFFTGDYDIHDLIMGREVVVTKKDMILLGELQKKLIATRLEKIGKREFEKLEDYQRIQHGPQYNYIAQMNIDNRGLSDIAKYNYIYETVADEALPVYLFVDGKWEEIETQEKLKNIYKNRGISIKDTWVDPDQRQKYIVNNIKKAIGLYIRINNLKDDSVDNIIARIIKDNRTRELRKSLKANKKDLEECVRDVKKVII